MVLVLVATGAGAEDVYRWIGPDGSPHFSDQPYPGAVRVPLPKFPPAQPRRYIQEPTGQSNNKSAFYVYRRLDIVGPKPGESIRDNEGNVEIRMTVDPDLNETDNHKIRLMLDGRVEGIPSQSLSQSLSGVARGRHTVTAQVVNELGRVLIRSRPVSFYMLSQSALFHPPRPGTPPVGVKQAPRAPMAPRAPRAPHVPFIPAQPRPTPRPLP